MNKLQKIFTLAIISVSLATFLSTSCSYSKDKEESKSESVEDAIKKFPEISHEDLEKAIGAMGVFIIDANSVETFEKGHIPSASSFAKEGKEIFEYLPEDKSHLIVSYCGSPECTAWLNPAQLVKALGYTNVKHYKGGIKGWKKSGGKTQTN